MAFLTGAPRQLRTFFESQSSLSDGETGYGKVTLWDREALEVAAFNLNPITMSLCGDYPSLAFSLLNKLSNFSIISFFSPAIKVKNIGINTIESVSKKLKNKLKKIKNKNATFVLTLHIE